MQQPTEARQVVGAVMRIAFYAVLALWTLIVGAALADHYSIGAGYVAIFGFLLGVTFLYACMTEDTES